MSKNEDDSWVAGIHQLVSVPLYFTFIYKDMSSHM